MRGFRTGFVTGRATPIRACPDPAPDDPAIMLMSGGTTGTPKAVVGLAPVSGHGRAAAQDLAARRRRVRLPDIALVPLPLFHVYACVGVQSHRDRQPHTDGARAEPARHRRPAQDDQDRPADAVQRRTRVVHRAAQSSEGQGQGSGLQLDPRLLFRRRPVDGGNQRAVRSAHRRPHRRGLFADGSDDGVRREPAEWRQQSWARSAFRFPTSKSPSSTRRQATTFLSTGETGEVVLRAPQLMAGYFNNADETRGRCVRMSDVTPSIGTGHGFTQAISAISTKTAICSSSIARRTSSRPAAIRSGRGKSRKCSPRTQACRTSAWPGCRTTLKGEVVKAWVVKRRRDEPHGR